MKSITMKYKEKICQDFVNEYGINGLNKTSFIFDTDRTVEHIDALKHYMMSTPVDNLAKHVVKVMYSDIIKDKEAHQLVVEQVAFLDNMLNAVVEKQIKVNNIINKIVNGDENEYIRIHNATDEEYRCRRNLLVAERVFLTRLFK